MTDYESLEDVAAELDRFRDVPNDVLSSVVVRDGSCMRLYVENVPPQWLNDPTTDRELAARVCAGCPVRTQCLELELRTAGPVTVGVWGALNETDRRALYPVWAARRAIPGNGGGR
ncbi:WhiB family transcriptional regulator [Labedaea rhizosphaerae]|uniref:WhiB family redox-sensing transcriptional regulator n=1 Tax=Labedaea rhizosphaerae TaxID=598644 RepID=A0A4R6RXM1_LABRH|nr:WhiB family transcriptional regulator [Labedaea rhizosphaerae]TDP91829.1 WhiB family redox-sensing transcriptional regulator [Labedaea rhizosphaerae]